MPGGGFLYSSPQEWPPAIGLQSASLWQGFPPEGFHRTPSNPVRGTKSCSPIAVEGLPWLYAILQRWEEVPEHLVVQAWPCLEVRMTPCQPTATKVRLP